MDLFQRLVSKTIHKPYSKASGSHRVKLYSTFRCVGRKLCVEYSIDDFGRKHLRMKIIETNRPKL